MLCDCKNFHFFDIGPIQFSCIFDWDYKHKPLWYVNHTAMDACWQFDFNKGFKSTKTCEAYMRKQVHKVCKQILKNIK